MLVWGSQGKIVNGGDAGNLECPVCKETRHFHYIVSYKIYHIWYLVRWSGSKDWATVCEVCNSAFPCGEPEVADAGVSGGQKRPNPVPLFDRWGWAMMLAPVALLIIFGIFAAQADDANDVKFVAAPVAGDLYSIDIVKFIGKDPSSPYSEEYGVFRVASVEGEKVILDIPRMVTNKMSGTSGEITSGKARSSSYYEGQMQSTVGQLVAAQKAGAIREVDR